MFTIGMNVSIVDGSLNYRDVQPGDVLCLQAGERDNLKLINLHGAPGKPIIVRNAGGTVTISGVTYLSGGIGIYASSYLRVTGTGTSQQCGAQVPANAQDCGIVINGTHKGIKIDTGTGSGDVSHIEIDHIAVSNISKYVKTRGISIHPLEKQVITNLYFHHNYVAHTLAEGFYIGSEPNERPYASLGKIENLDISYNLVEDTGYEGINVKVAVKNVQVHHNVVRRTGLSRTPTYQGGIKIAMSTGEVYNNYVEDSYEGIRSTRPLENPGTTLYFNNIVINARNVAIETAEEGAQIFNNTVVWCGTAGIVGDVSNTVVFDNIIAGCDGQALKGLDKARFSNLLGSVERIGFVDPEQNDFRLKSRSRAVDAGRYGNLFLSFDFADQPRPVGKHPDMGAFEYQSWVSAVWQP
ncbi:MAG TPA: choice-of-anchor Q domain-containing protein [Anaerolineaceae bacterium]|nr:choice-of-anchor Q domain-containing protein [Anaerolineaceae bacterium]